MHALSSSRVSLWSLSPSLVVTGVLALLLAALPASAHKKFAKKEGVECKECHVSPEGGGPRNVIGTYYEAKHELPLDRSPETMKLVQDTVNRYLFELSSTPPDIVWSHTPLAHAPEQPQKSYAPASDLEVLRRLSLDWRGTVPSTDEVARLSKGQVTLAQLADEYLASKDFQSTFFLYHMDLIRPRTGIYNTTPSLTHVGSVVADGENVFISNRLPGELGAGACNGRARVKVSPWWDRKKTMWACAKTGSTALTATVAGKTVHCDTDEGQASGECGCGPWMVFCYPDGINSTIIKSMREEMANLAMEVVNQGLPYSDVVTSDWTMNNGRLQVFYAKLNGTLASLKDEEANADAPWHRVMRDARHSGVLTTPAMFNFFYNGRRWAQRTFEAFFCHEVYPDFDLLDDTHDAGKRTGVPYRDHPTDLPSASVTEGRACASCHLQLDGLSRVKDRWDPFGRYMETSNGMSIAQEAIFEGQKIDGMDGLGKALAKSEVFHDCVVNQVWTHMVGHRFRPDELGTRRALVDAFERDNLNFKNLLKSVASTKEYRSKSTVKIMTKELYVRAMGRTTDVAWKVNDKSGWETFYDKIGGMDYRKIESRDRNPSPGHVLVQMKGASESCSESVNRDMKKSTKAERHLLTEMDDIKSMPSEQTLDVVLSDWYARIFGRTWDQVPDDEKSMMRGLFFKIAKKKSVADGYKAVCTALFGSEDFALF